MEYEAGFGGQLCYVVHPGKFMAGGEAYKFKRLNVLQWMTRERDQWVSLKTPVE